MKRTSFLLVAGLCLGWCHGQGFAAEPALRAGAAAVDITPVEFPLNMPGGFNANMSESAHDPLHARALVLDDGTTQAAVVVVDNLGVGPETCDEARAAASAKCGLAPDKIMIFATHTHSAPSSGPGGGSGPQAA
ncbi:MAG TPA: hypothetical protein PKG77_22620, partial [Phycisphaerae bacterium]|nr:hypothetical protein [Phycisphaerae bacterium]